MNIFDIRTIEKSFISDQVQYLLFHVNLNSKIFKSIFFYYLI